MANSSGNDDDTCGKGAKIAILLFLLAFVAAGGTVATLYVKAQRKKAKTDLERGKEESGKETEKEEETVPEAGKEKQEITLETLQDEQPSAESTSLETSAVQEHQQLGSEDSAESIVAQPIDELQDPEALQIFQSSKYAGLQCLPVENIHDVDKTSPAVFYKFTGPAQEQHRIQPQPFSEEEPALEPELQQQITAIFDAFLLDLSLVWFFLEVEVVACEPAATEYTFTFTVKEHLLADSHSKSCTLSVKQPTVKSIDKHMNNIWIASEAAKPEELDLHLLRSFSYQLTGKIQGEQMKLILPVALLRPQTQLAPEAADIWKLCQVAKDNFASQVISYCIEDENGKCHLFYDIVNPPTDQVVHFERISTFLFTFPSENKRWNWKALVDGDKPFYPDPICIEEHFTTISHFSYSVIICPMWEVFIGTGSEDNAKHYNILLNVGESIKMLVISQVNSQKMLLQFLTENPMSEVKSASITEPATLKYAFIGIVADLQPATGHYEFIGVDEEEDIEGLLAEIENAKKYFAVPTVELPSLSYKIKFWTTLILRKVCTL